MEKIVHMIDPYLGNINRRGAARSKCGQDLDPGVEWTEFPGRTTCQPCLARPETVRDTYGNQVRCEDHRPRFVRALIKPDYLYCDVCSLMEPAWAGGRGE